MIGQDYDDSDQDGTVHDDPPTRRLVLRPASTITPRPVRWLWDTAADAEPRDREGRFPVGSLVLAVGRAGLGKSQFGCWLTARVTTGTLPGAHWGKPRAVIYAASEDSWEMTIVPRLIAAGADLDRVYRVSVVDDDDLHARLTLPSDNTLLERSITDHDVAVVVMDPLLSLIDSRIDDYRAREVRQALEPLVALADRTGASLLGLAHFTKGTGSDPLMLVSGSAAFGQLVRAAVAFASDDDADDGYVLSTIKNNLGRENLPSLAYTITPQAVPTPEGDTWVSRVDFTGESERSVHDLLRGADGDDGEDVRGWLHAYLTRHGGSATPEDITKAGRAAGYSSDQLKRAKKSKGTYRRVYSRKTGFNDGWVWSLEPGSDQSDEGSEEREGSEEGVHKEVAPFVAEPPNSAPSYASLPSPPSPSSLPSADQGESADGTTTCVHCGQILLLVAPGRDTCEGCRLNNQPCDRCQATPTRVDRTGARWCETCAPHLFKVAS